MHQVKNKIYEIISKLASGNALTGPEKKEFDDWLNKSKSNQQLYDELLLAWKVLGGNNTREIDPDVDAEWARFKSLREKKNNQPERKAFSIRQTITIAASIAFLITTGVFFYGKYKPVTVSAKNSTLSHSLPDGSVIELNHNTTIKYSKDFGKKSRNINLQGEAFFEVRKSGTPFIIETINGITTKVLGTKFNLKASKNCKKVELNVYEGRVQFSLKDGSVPLIVSTKEAAIFDVTENSFKRLDYNDNKMAWKTKKLIFNATPLSESIPYIEELYNISIKIPQGSGSLLFSSTFEKSSLTEVADVIGLTFGWDYKQTNSNLTFY